MGGRGARPQPHRPAKDRGPLQGQRRISDRGSRRSLGPSNAPSALEMPLLTRQSASSAHRSPFLQARTNAVRPSMRRMIAFRAALCPGVLPSISVPQFSSEVAPSGWHSATASKAAASRSSGAALALDIASARTVRNVTFFVMSCPIVSARSTQFVRVPSVDAKDCTLSYKFKQQRELARMLQSI